MNNLYNKRKKYTFQVDLKVEELVHVPFVNEELFVKLRLLKGGGFSNNSKSLMVNNHSVRWDQMFKFSCKMTANASTGELDTCICRVSVRQEVRGGRSYQKLGRVNVNLAQFAGCGGSQSYLLEEYNSKHRLHNSMLKVSVFMILSAGDICFKAQPWPRQLHSVGTLEGTPENTKSHLPRAPSLTSSLTSIGYSSLDKKVKADDKECQDDSEQTGHSRNSSNTSGSGYVSNASHSDKSATHVRTVSQGSNELYSEEGSLERPSSRLKTTNHSDSCKDPRVVETRVNANEMIDQIFEDTLGTWKDDSIETSGLQLFIKEDGTASVRGHRVPARTEFRPMTIPKR